MTRLTMLVTSEGEWVLADSPEFFAVLGDPNPDYDGVGFAVRNLGCIKFEILDRSLVEIEMHPCQVKLPALLAVQQQLQTCPQHLFRIKYFDEAWRSEISSSAPHTITRLSELCAPVREPSLPHRFLVERRDLATLFADEDNELRPLAQKWRVSFANFDPSITALALRQNLLSRLIIIGVNPREREPRFRFIGDGHRWMGADYQLKGVGEKTENMPDKEYGGWVSEYYRSVAESGQPRYDMITGMLQYQNEDQRPQRMVRYARLLLPWKTPSAEVFVTMCSKLVGTVPAVDAPYALPESREAMNSANSS